MHDRAKSLTLEREPEYIFRACFHAWKIIVRRNLTLLLRHLSIESYVTLLNPDWLVAIFPDIASRSTSYNAIFTHRDSIYKEIEIIRFEICFKNYLEK